MSKTEITVTCLYADEGDTVSQIIFRSFGIFLKRELMHDDLKPTFSPPYQL